MVDNLASNWVAMSADMLVETMVQEKDDRLDLKMVDYWVGN